MSFLGLSCMSTLLEIFMSQHPLVRRVVSLSITNLHFSVSISITLLIIGKNQNQSNILFKLFSLRCCVAVLQTSDGILVGIIWSFTPPDSPGQSLGQ